MTRSYIPVEGTAKRWMKNPEFRAATLIMFGRCSAVLAVR
jgi:hypothetical protein